MIGDVEYEVVAHDFQETIEVPIGKFRDIEECKRAIEKFDKEQFPIIFCPNIMMLWASHAFEELELTTRVYVRRTDTGELLRLG